MRHEAGVLERDVASLYSASVLTWLSFLHPPWCWVAAQNFDCGAELRELLNDFFQSDVLMMTADLQEKARLGARGISQDWTVFDLADIDFPAGKDFEHF